MSDDEHNIDIDIESDVSDVSDVSNDDDDSDSTLEHSNNNTQYGSQDGDDSDSTLGHSNNAQYGSQAEKREHHNALERKRRNHIKDKFTRLKNVIPSIRNKPASRAQILRKTIDHIREMKRDISEKEQANAILDEEINFLENRANGLERLINDKIAQLKKAGKPIPDFSKTYDMDAYFSADSDSDLDEEIDRQLQQYNFSYD